MVSVSPQGLKQANALRTFDIGLHALHYYPMVPKKKMQNSVSFADQSVKPKTQELLKQKSVSLTLAEQYVKHKNQEPLKQRTKNNKKKKKNKKLPPFSVSNISEQKATPSSPTSKPKKVKKENKAAKKENKPTSVYMENDYMINSWMKTLEKLAQDNNAEIVGPLSLYAIIPEFINCYSKSTNCSYKGQTPANETSFRNYIAEVITRENEHSICNHLADYIVKEEAFDESLSKALHHIKSPDPSSENHQADAKAWKVIMGMFDNKLQINSKSLDFTKNLYWKNNRYIFIKTKPTHHPSTAADKKCKTLISDRTSTHKSKADSNKFYLKFVETLSTLDDTEYSVESVQNGVRGKLKEFEHHGIKFTDKTIQGLISDELITKAEIAALEDLYEINIKVIPDQKTGSTKEEFDLKLVRSVQTGTQTSEEHMFSLTNTNPAHIHYAVTSAIGLAAWFCNHSVENVIQLYINICTANNMPILKLPESFINLIIETQKAQSFDWNLLYKAMAYMEQDHAPNEVCLEQSKAASYALRESKKNDMFKFNQDETNSIINASRNLAETFNIENVVTPLTSPNISASRNPAETDNMENETPSLTELSENLIIDLSDSIVSIEQNDECDSTRYQTGYL